jgi:hypothetical protein
MQNPCPGCQKKWAWHAGRGCGPCDVCEEKEAYETWKALHLPQSTTKSAASNQ